MSKDQPSSTGEKHARATVEEDKSYMGMWVTGDGYIRQELLPNGTYDEARGKTKSAYTGKYWMEGNHIKYKDDTDFSAIGDFVDGVLHHGGYLFYKEEQKR